MKIRLLALLMIPLILACSIATPTPAPVPTIPSETNAPTAMASSIPSSTSEPVLEIATVSAEVLEVRACPSESCRTLGYFHEGDGGRVLTRDGGDGMNCSGWIVLLRPELVGWVCADWVQ